MKEKVEFKDIPKGKEKDRFYYFPVSKKTKVNTNTPFMREFHKLVNGEIDEVDLEKVKKEFKTDQNSENIKEK